MGSLKIREHQDFLLFFIYWCLFIICCDVCIIRLLVVNKSDEVVKVFNNLCLVVHVVQLALISCHLFPVLQWEKLLLVFFNVDVKEVKQTCLLAWSVSCGHRSCDWALQQTFGFPPWILVVHSFFISVCTTQLLYVSTHTMGRRTVQTKVLSVLPGFPCAWLHRELISFLTRNKTEHQRQRLVIKLSGLFLQTSVEEFKQKLKKWAEQRTGS